MARRILLNCWIVAMWIWIAGHCRQYAWIRRSHSFRGMIPHFGVADATQWRWLRVVEYVPPKSALWSRRNKLLFFDGSYRVWHFRLVSVRRHRSRDKAMSDCRP